jgi:CRP/FNR family cyclic AMP-dependent transcriptional regulator
VFRKDVKIAWLKRVPLFSGCSRRELGEIAAIADEMRFPEGRTLIKEGAVGRELFVVLDGTVEVRRGGRKLTPKGDTSFFGEAALLTGARRNATVMTTSPVQALVITDRAFRRLLGDSPAIQRRILDTLAARLADAD